MLVLSLPTRNGTARMRAWRSLKALGAAVLRDGVYLLPERDALVQALAAVAADVKASEGQAKLLRVEALDGDDFARLFDRSADYAVLLTDIAQLRREEPKLADDALAAHVAGLGKRFDQLRGIDHLPGEATRQAEAALADLQALAARRGQPDEPHAAPGAIPRRLRAEHQGRLWATRRRPWVDRLASAWLIRRFIDTRARFLWLDDVRRCPPDALGFDFDGATFSHVGARVTFETLLAAFDLETPALRRLGALVHRLDAGGAPVPEADGVERVLAGMRQALADDDQLFLAAAGVFEGLWTAFEREATA
ncbi:chromate resistance protein ChrB domain-containing protein [Ideonella sp. A 288]|uniref:chromate resistance protein ChrB domain-containing protein n=1 Tax=Ideonella sp. A 288 TaxID=1962181 RepID=UPI001F302B08|nr:chromate resistance protein ChrB domain-containing protein [Ideonella sp. A 288]